MADSGVYDTWHLSHPPDDAATCPEHKGLVPAARHGKGLRWQARWRTLADKQEKQNFRTKAEAQTHLTDVLSKRHAGIYVDAAGGRRRLEDYATEWLAAQTTDPATREVNERRVNLHLLPELGDKELRAIRPSTVQAWLRDLSDKLAPNSVRNVYGCLTAILHAAVDDGLIGRSPCAAKSVKPPAPERPRIIPWTGQRVTDVTGALPERYRVVAVLASGLGLRRGECFGLSVDDVDFLRKVVHVRRQIRRVRNRLVFAPPKGGKERDVPLPGQVALRLAAHLQAYPAVAVTLPWKMPEGQDVTARLLVTNSEDRAVAQHVFYKRAWYPALKAAGVPSGRKNGMHALRHYYASVALEGSVSIKALAEYLGHADPAFTLRIYTHLMPSSEDRVRAAVDAAFTACAPHVPQEAAHVPS